MAANICADACVAIDAQSRRPDHVIVVDNASGDGSLSDAQSQFPQFRYIANATNVGFAAANNQAFDSVSSLGVEYVALLNPDAFAAPDWLATAAGRGGARNGLRVVGFVPVACRRTDARSTDWAMRTTSAAPRGAAATGSRSIGHGSSIAMSFVRAPPPRCIGSMRSAASVGSTAICSVTWKTSTSGFDCV